MVEASFGRAYAGPSTPTRRSILGPTRPLVCYRGGETHCIIHRSTEPRNPPSRVAHFNCPPSLKTPQQTHITKGATFKSNANLPSPPSLLFLHHICHVKAHPFKLELLFKTRTIYCPVCASQHKTHQIIHHVESLTQFPFLSLLTPQSNPINFNLFPLCSGKFSHST